MLANAAAHPLTGVSTPPMSLAGLTFERNAPDPVRGLTPTARRLHVSSIEHREVWGERRREGFPGGLREGRPADAADPRRSARLHEPRGVRRERRAPARGLGRPAQPGARGRLPLRARPRLIAARRRTRRART